MSNIILGTTQMGLARTSSQNRNQHVAFLGPSGVGKTSAMVSVAIQKAEAGETVIAFNTRNCFDLESLMPQVKKAYAAHRRRIDVANGELLLPLFEHQVDIRGNKENDLTVVHRVSSNLAHAADLTPAQRRRVDHAVKMIAKKGHFATKGLTAIQQYLEEQGDRTADNAAGKLRSLIELDLVHEGNCMDDAAGIFEFDLNLLEYDDQQIVLRFLLDYLLRMAQKGHFRERGIAILLDEAQNLSFKPDSTMYTLVNESRKLNVTLLLAATKIFSSKSNMNIVEQCGTTCYFKPTPGDRKNIAKAISPKNAGDFAYLLADLAVGEYIATGIFNVDGMDTSMPLTMQTYFCEDWQEKVPELSSSSKKETEVEIR